MGFQLTIAEGKEAGREFAFEQPSVVIGRTSECDVILYDPGVSRKHARIFEENAAYFVEDMGSANGTKVNGNVVKRAQLSDGDAVSLGPVVFSFAAVAAVEDVTDAGVAGENTRIVATRDVKRAAGGGSALAPVNADATQLRALARSSTKAIPAVRPRPSGGATPLPPFAADDDSPRGLSVAERARIRRENPGLMGGVRIWWLEAAEATRNTLVLFLGLLALGAVGGIGYWLLTGTEGPQLPPEPTVLARKPIAESFGLGEGVAYEQADQKSFDVEYSPPTSALLIVHFQSRDIAEKEVAISVGGAPVDFVPADTLDVEERSHEVIIRPERLQRGVNQLVFDNTLNPPGAESWRIWNAWAELVPLIGKPSNQLVLDAQESFDRGTRTFEQRDVGASNRYKAWKDFREAWLILESIEGAKPELYELARTQMRMAQQELDQRCRLLLIDFQRDLALQQFEAARATLEHVKDYFPANDQPCFWRAEKLRYEHDL